MSMLKEFKPTILFLLRFVGLYFFGNLVYGILVSSYGSQPDPITIAVTDQSATVLSVFYDGVSTHPSSGKPTCYVLDGDRQIIAVYEGCNGVNVIIIFVSFLLAFGPYKSTVLWFLPMGIIAIHLTNLARLVLLYFVSLRLPDYLYFTHKYLFTGFIYVIVLILWVWWVRLGLGGNRTSV